MISIGVVFVHRQTDTLFHITSCTIAIKKFYKISSILLFLPPSSCRAFIGVAVHQTLNTDTPMLPIGTRVIDEIWSQRTGCYNGSLLSGRPLFSTCQHVMRLFYGRIKSFELKMVLKGKDLIVPYLGLGRVLSLSYFYRDLSCTPSHLGTGCFRTSSLRPQ